jgi:hypothetical protein
MHSTQNKYGSPGINTKIEPLFYLKAPVVVHTHERAEKFETD